MSHTNLITINCTEINNSGPLRVGDNLSSGTAGQVLKSNGDYIAPSWETDIDTTYQGSSTIDIDTTTDPDTINVIKVPNDLTISQNGTIIDTFNGSVAKTIDLEGKYSAGCGIEISGHPIPVIEADTDETTITKNLLGAEQLSVLKVPNTLTFTGYSTGTFDGSAALNINLVDTDTTYTAGFGIAFSGIPATQINANPDNTTIDYNGAGYSLRVLKIPNSLSAGNNLSFSSGLTFDGSAARTIDLDSNLLNIDTLSFTNTSGVTALIGSITNPTALLFCDLTSSSNITSPYFLHDVYDPSVTDLDSLTTSFAFIFSSNLKNSFKAQKTSCCIELLIYNYSITGNAFLYLQLGDNIGTEWSVGSLVNGGGSGTGTRNTARTTAYTDETDKVCVRHTWYLTGLTIGSSYTINPMARTSSTTNYIYAGGSYPACILRGYYLPS